VDHKRKGGKMKLNRITLVSLVAITAATQMLGEDANVERVWTHTDNVELIHWSDPKAEPSKPKIAAQPSLIDLRKWTLAGPQATTFDFKDTQPKIASHGFQMTYGEASLYTVGGQQSEAKEFQISLFRRKGHAR
jgi:hypothetical protein